MEVSSGPIPELTSNLSLIKTVLIQLVGTSPVFVEVIFVVPILFVAAFVVIKVVFISEPEQMVHL